MKSRKILTILLASTLALSAVLVGCQKKTEPSPQTDQQLDADQTINIVGFDFSSLDPSKVSDANSFTSLNAGYEGLGIEVEENGTLKTVLAGAEKLEKSTDGLTYTFTLRDAKWTDGKSVTAKDYEYSWRRLCDRTISEDYLMFLDELGVKNARAVAEGKMPLDQLGVKAKDDKTFVVTLEHPTPYFESALCFKGLVPQREDIAKKLGDQYGIDWKGMVYNGPFTISEYQKGSKIVYTKNESYWNAKSIKLKTANCQIVTEQATISKMFDAKELDVSGFSGDYLKRYTDRAKSGDINHVTGFDGSTFYVVYNTTAKALSSSKIRLALSLTYDRQQLLDAVYKRFVPAMGYVPNMIALNGKEFRSQVPEPLKSVKDDPKKLLSDGLKELGMDPDPAKLNLKLLMSQASSTTTALAQFLQNQWQSKLGIKITIQHAVDGPSYFTQRTKGDFDICSGGWSPDYNDPNTYFNIFTTGNGNNNGKYSNPEYDKLVKQAAGELDQAKRVDIYKQAEQLLVIKDAAVSPMYYRDIHSFRYPYVKGFYVPIFSGNFDLRNTYISGKNK